MNIRTLALALALLPGTALAQLGYGYTPPPAGSGNVSGGSVTATGSTTAQTLANWAANSANVLFFGADPTGVADSATAINAAAATGKEVWLPSGTYYVKSALNVSGGQCLYGDGDNATWLKIDQGFSSSASGVIVMGGSAGLGACVHDIGFTFAQPSTQSSRASYATLAAGCTSGSGGTGCMYPPAIYDAVVTRPRLWNLSVWGAWDGITLVGNVVPWIQNVEMGALDIGLQMDGGQDFSHIKGWHSWEFGLTATGPAAIYSDGTTIGWQIGREDGLNAVDADFFSARLIFTANASNSVATNQLTNIDLDNGASTLEINGGTSLQFANVYKTGTSPTATCPINVTAGTTQIDQLNLSASASTNLVCVTGGALRVVNGFVSLASAASSAFYETGGGLRIDNTYFSVPSAMTGTVISQTGGYITVRNSFSWPGTSGTFLSVGSDNASNNIQGNNFPGYVSVVPTGAVSGFYQVPLPSVGLTSSIGIGSQALNQIAGSGATAMTAVGVNALSGVLASGAASDTAAGENACKNVTTAANAVCLGANAGSGLTTGTQDTFVGAGAGALVTTGNNNTIISEGAGAGLAGGSSANVIVGPSASSAAGTYNYQVALGYYTIKSATAGSNTAIGANVGPTLTTGTGNILIGTSSATNVPTGSTSNYLNIGGVLTGNISTGALAISGSAASLAVPTVIMPLTTPASSSAACTAGQVAVDANYIYVCTATNTWKRAPVSTW